MARRADQINGLKLDVKTGKLSLWRLFPTFTFTFTLVFSGIWLWVCCVF